MLGKTSLVVETNVRVGGLLGVILFRRTGFVALKIDISKFQLSTNMFKLCPTQDESSSKPFSNPRSVEG